MAGFELLYAAQFLMSTATTAYEHNLAQVKADRERADAYRQVASNNQANFNGHLNLNYKQILELKKFGLDRFELQKKIRREQAKDATMRGSSGGTFGQVGGSFRAAQQNIERYGFNALVRKDRNFKVLIDDFNARHANVDANTISQNNTAFSDLSIGPSFLGSALSIAGTGLQTGISYKQDIEGIRKRKKSSTPKTITGVGSLVPKTTAGSRVFTTQYPKVGARLPGAAFRGGG